MNLVDQNSTALSQSVCNSARRLFFIGGGSLLAHAVSHAHSLGFYVELVVCPMCDPALNKIKALGISLMESNDPSATLINYKIRKEDVVFSINNKFILNDSLLSLGAEFFNIHNGPIQSYRGVGEVCVFAALCNGDTQYGVTLHNILAGTVVDSGPIVEQLFFSIEENDDFSIVMKKSLLACREIFVRNFSKIMLNDYVAKIPDALGKIYNYKNIVVLCKNSDPDRLVRARSFGPFENLLPKLFNASVEKK